MKPSDYILKTDKDGEKIIIFPNGKTCSCGVTYLRLSGVKTSPEGYWFNCPVCHSTMFARKE